MVKLSEFVGEVVSELSQARQMADAASVRLSQTYHSDSFMKEMPVPHYTIAEAEVAFPLSIVDMESDYSEDLERSIISAIKLKLPGIMFLALKTAYLEKKKAGILKEQEEKLAHQNLNNNVINQNPADEILVDIEKTVERQYSQSANNISANLEEKMKNYLATVNLDVIKPLDIKDILMDMLQKEYISEFAKYDTSKQPVEDNDGLANLIKSVGTGIFFEFTRNAGKDGILVEASTGRLNEYAGKDNMMNIKLKIREQDLDVVVAGDDDSGSARRFLTLS